MSSKLSLSRKAFTLVELLVVIAIIGILVGMILPAVQAAREAARRATCLNNVKQLALASLNYESTNSTLPPAVGTNKESWLLRILPQMELKTLYDDFRADPGTLLTNLSNNPIESFRCASAATSDLENGLGTGFTSHYAGSSGSGVNGLITVGDPMSGTLASDGIFSPILVANPRNPGPFGNKKGVPTTDVLDGLSNTIGVIETSRSDFTSSSGGSDPVTFTNVRSRWSRGLDDMRDGEVNWARTIIRTINSFDETSGEANPQHTLCISSNHSGGANVANGDGSVNFVSEDQDIAVLQAAAGIDDGQTVNINQ